MKFIQHRKFMESARDLYQKGGKYQRAGQQVYAAWGRAHEGASVEQIFEGLTPTNHGERRIPHCVKYDLSGFARLVTVLHDEVCFFLYAGDHDNCERWIERN